MKTISSVRGIVLRTFLASAIFGAITTTAFSAGEWVELTNLRDSNTRVWQVERDARMRLPGGRLEPERAVSTIIEKASGMHYRDSSGELRVCVPEWREAAEGFVIERCQYKLRVPSALSSAVEFELEGHQMLLRPCRIAVTDGDTTVTLGTVDATRQARVPSESPGVLCFMGAFGDGYDLEFVAEKAGFHQNLMLSRRPGVPQGMARDKARLVIYTEVNLDGYLSGGSAEIRIGGSRIVDMADPRVVEVPYAEPIAFTSTGTHEGLPAGQELWMIGDSVVWDNSFPARRRRGRLPTEKSVGTLRPGRFFWSRVCLSRG